MENQVNDEVKVEQLEEVKTENTEEEIIFHDDTPVENTKPVSGEKNKLAIASLVCAILSIIILFIPSDAMWIGGLYYLLILVGFVLSIVALVQIKKKNQSGKIYAVLGLLGVILSFVLILVLGFIEIANMPEDELNDMLYCPNVTECVDNKDGTSKCVYIDGREFNCTTELLSDDQFK